MRARVDVIVSEWAHAHARTRTHARPAAQVDVIVSEWMGFYLFHESMLDSVLKVSTRKPNRLESYSAVCDPFCSRRQARERFLKVGGRLFPQRATLWAAPVCSTELHAKLSYWDGSPYGLDLTAMKELAVDRLLERPAVLSLNAGELLAAPQQVGGGANGGGVALSLLGCVVTCCTHTVLQALGCNMLHVLHALRCNILHALCCTRCVATCRTQCVARTVLC
jgi:hypothetical protein